MTLPALRQEVQTLTRFGVAPTIARTRWMLGFQRRLVRRCEWEMLLPKPGPLPQTSQVAATGYLLGKSVWGPGGPGRAGGPVSDRRRASPGSR